MEVSNKLGQYELLPLCAARSRQYIRHRLVNRGPVSVSHALQVGVKPNISWQLKALILRSEWSHALIRPHSRGA